MVEFSTLEGNESNKFLIQDYYLSKFVTNATYKNNKIESIDEWLKTILSDDFNFKDITIVSSPTESSHNLAQDLIIPY